jgi:hypothetical protein
MSIKIMTEVWETSRLTSTQLLLCLALADYANDDRKCWPSVPSLAAKARISERQTVEIATSQTCIRWHRQRNWANCPT